MRNMKKNLAYIQISILNEVMLVYNTRDLADQMTEYLREKGIDLYIYETHEDGIMFRRKKDATVTDDMMIKAFVWGIGKLIDKSKKSGNSIEDSINDNYDFEFDKKYLADSFGAEVLTIRSSGRIISLEIDI